jgi:hypothetical protein
VDDTLAVSRHTRAHGLPIGRMKVITFLSHNILKWMKSGIIGGEGGRLARGGHLVCFFTPTCVRRDIKWGLFFLEWRIKVPLPYIILAFLVIY